MLNGLTQFRKDKPKHALYKSRCIKKDKEYVDPKTLVAMIATDQPFHTMGAGSTRNLGIKIVHKQPANKIIAISEEPLQVMDLVNFTKQEYEQNGYYIHGLLALHYSDFTMLGNTRIPMNAKGDLEKFNCKLIFRSLPEKDGLRSKHNGVYAYIKTTRVMQALDFVIFEKYGSGAQSLLWGQTPTLKRQIENMARYEENEVNRKEKRQIGNDTCNECGFPLPRLKKDKQVHRLNECAKNRVKGKVDRYQKK